MFNALSDLRCSILQENERLPSGGIKKPFIVIHADAQIVCCYWGSTSKNSVQESCSETYNVVIVERNGGVETV
jgi:hypothetical protein